jgi:general secretion pathway protein D
MMLDSGQTAVIGGLTTESETEIMSRVPYLSRIPLLGSLFRYEDSARDRRSLIVFLTPAIVQSRDDTERLLQRELGRRRADLRSELEALAAPVVDTQDGGGIADF